ncbi:hypothetical protein [Streptomyces sp. CLCI03]
MHFRVGSAANAADVDTEARVSLVSPGEPVPVLVAATYGSALDYAVVVTWRGWLGRRQRWTYIVN